MVYPRECGGTPDKTSVNVTKFGLSPRVRGNRVRGRVRVRGRGSIPASAGEPSGTKSWSELAPVYPRECGGTCREAPTGPPLPGLSPRVRGNPDQHISALLGERSIPASAGEPIRLV